MARLTSEYVYDFFASSDDLVAIYGPIPEATKVWKEKGYQEKYGKLQFRKPLQTLSLWIATGKNSENITPEAWEDALNKVKASGAYKSY